MADVPQTPTAGAPARTDLLAFFPPAGTGDPVTRTVDDALRASTGRRTTNADGNITAADLDKTVVVTGSTARTQTLPDITGAVDARYLVRIVNGSTADQTISGNGSDTINGSASIVLEPTEAILLQPAASGTAWMILSREIVRATKGGVRRRNVTELSTTTAALPGVSLMTASYTPKVANARLTVKVRIAAAVQGNSDNDYAGLTVRVKRGSGNYKRIDEGADGYTKVWWRRMWQYWDGGAGIYQDEFELEPQNNTDEVKVNVSLYSQDGNTVQNVAGRLNRTAGEGMRNAGPSYIEISEMVEDGSMTYQTATTLDSA